MKRLALSLLFYAPFLGAIIGGAWYLKRIMPAAIADFFGLPNAQIMAGLMARRVEYLRETLSFPLGLPQYLSAQTANLTAAAKLTTIELTTNISLVVLTFFLNVIVIMAVVYVVFRLLKHYKARASENRTAILVTNRLLPVLEEINANILDIKTRLSALESKNTDPAID